MKRHKKQPGGRLQKVAAQHGVSTGEAKREMLAAIDAAWNNPDAATRKRQRQLFPNGKPTVAEFIEVMAQEVKGE